MIHLGVNLGIIAVGLLVFRWNWRKHFKVYGPDDLLPEEINTRKKKQITKNKAK